MAYINVNTRVINNFKNDDISALLNSIIDNELSKDVSRVNTKLVDDCVEAIIKLEQEENDKFSVLIPLVNSNAFLKSLQQEKTTWKNLNVFARTAIIAALLAGTTITANAAYQAATGVNLLGNLGSAIHDKLLDWGVIGNNEPAPVIDQFWGEDDGDDTTEVTTSAAEQLEESTIPVSEQSATTKQQSTKPHIDQLEGEDDDDSDSTSKKPDSQDVSDKETTRKPPVPTTAQPNTLPPVEEPENIYLVSLNAEFEHFKTDYIYGEELSYDGLKLTAVYSDKSTKPVSLDACSYTKNINMNVTADYTLRIIYESCIVTVNITVRPDEETRGAEICENEDYEYFLTEKGAYITKYKGSETRITLDTVDNNEVYAIGAEVFADSELAYFTAQNVFKIFPNAFKNCKVLEDCNVPNAVYIGQSAFENCESLKTAIFSENLTYFGKSVYKNSGIESISVPSGITQVPESLCEACKSLKTAELGKNTEIIGKAAFSECEALESVSNTENIKEVLAFAFYECSAATLDSNVSKLEVAEEYCFAYCNNIDFGALNPNIKEIGPYAFAYCTKLSEVNIPQGFETIPEGAFRGAHIATLTLPEGLKIIDDYAFMSTEFRELTVPNSVEEVGTYGLYSVRLREIRFGRNIKELGQSAVFKSSRLVMYVYKNTAPYEYAVENNINYTLIDE